jgi:hypothetical protein
MGRGELKRLNKDRAKRNWAFGRYLDMGPLWGAKEKSTKIAT